jgi:two-component system, sensor histidine kinase
MENTSDYTWPDKRILYIEDDELSIFLVKEYLMNTKANLIPAYDGETGVHLFKKDSTFDLVIIDLQLPNMSGFDVFHEIRSIKPHQPIIAHTALCTDEIISMCQKQGFDECILKPLEPSIFYSKLNKYLN